MLQSSSADMDDNSINRELKQKLNFSCCEGNEDEEREEARGSGEAQSQTPERSEVKESEAKFTPPRTPLRNARELDTSQEKDGANPDPGWRTPVCESPQCPKTPARPDDRSKLLQCESPFTPKVSKLSGRGSQVPSSVQVTERGISYLCVFDRFAPPQAVLSPNTYLLVKMKKFEVTRKQSNVLLKQCQLSSQNHWCQQRFGRKINLGLRKNS